MGQCVIQLIQQQKHLKERETIQVTTIQQGFEIIIVINKLGINKFWSPYCPIYCFVHMYSFRGCEVVTTGGSLFAYPFFTSTIIWEKGGNFHILSKI